MPLLLVAERGHHYAAENMATRTLKTKKSCARVLAV